MEKITNIDELKTYLHENLEMDSLLEIEDNTLDARENFQKGFDSGYANSYANLLFIIDEDFRQRFAKMVNCVDTTSPEADS